MVARLAGSCPFFLILCASLVFAEDRQEVDVGDLAKTLVVERPTRLLVARSSELPANSPARKTSPEQAVDDQETKVADEAKRVVELPAKNAIADVGKLDLESPVKAALAQPLARPLGQMNPSAAAAARTSAPSKNPKVAPGKVKWHADFAAACAASRKSGKPVLHFQLLGNLDDQFC